MWTCVGSCRFFLPVRSAAAARTEWGSSPGRGWGRSPPESSPSAAPDPRTARRTAGSDPKQRTWRWKLLPRVRGGENEVVKKGKRKNRLLSVSSAVDVLLLGDIPDRVRGGLFGSGAAVSSRESR